MACLAELTGAAPTAVSQHVAKLRLSWLVKGRREGTFVDCSAEDDHVRRLLTQALYHADHIDRTLPNAARQPPDPTPCSGTARTRRATA